MQQARQSSMETEGSKSVKALTEPMGTQESRGGEGPRWARAGNPKAVSGTTARIFRTGIVPMTVHKGSLRDMSIKPQ